MNISASHPGQRVGIFVDVQNLYHSAKNLYRARVNYKELLRHLVGERELIRAMAYVVKSEGILPPGEKEQSANRAAQIADASGGMKTISAEAAFFEALTAAGMELRLKDLQVWADGAKKADWDVGMAVDAIRMSAFLDVVILVTGDGDFIPLVEYLKWGTGRLVEVAAFHRSASAKLQESADHFIDLEKVPKIIMRSRAASKSR